MARCAVDTALPRMLVATHLMTPESLNLLFDYIIRLKFIRKKSLRS